MIFLWVLRLWHAILYYSVFSVAIKKSFGIEYLSAKFGILLTSQLIIGAVVIGFVSDYVVLIIGWSGTFLLIGTLSLMHAVFIY